MMIIQLVKLTISGSVIALHTNRFVVVRDSVDNKRLGTVWMVRGSNSGGGESFRTRPNGPWGSTSLLYNGYTFSFPGIKRQGCCTDHQPHIRPKLKDRRGLYLYFYSPFTACSRVELYLLLHQKFVI